MKQDHVFKDFMGDALMVETDSDSKVCFFVADVCGEESSAVVLDDRQVKKLRKVLNQWLIINGHKGHN